MPIIARDTGGASGYSQGPAAPPGTHAAVCVDVIDMGILKVVFGGKEKSQHKVRVVWQIDERRPDGKPYEVSKRYTLSLHEKASLRKDLESWRGKPFTHQELDAFDLELLLSAPALLNVIQVTKQDRTYANVTGLMKLPKVMPAPTPSGYVRVCDRKTENGAIPPPGFEDGPDVLDEDVPF